MGSGASKRCPDFRLNNTLSARAHNHLLFFVHAWLLFIYVRHINDILTNKRPMTGCYSLYSRIKISGL